MIVMLIAMSWSCSSSFYLSMVKSPHWGTSVIIARRSTRKCAAQNLILGGCYSSRTRDFSDCQNWEMVELWCRWSWIVGRQESITCSTAHRIVSEADFRQVRLLRFFSLLMSVGRIEPLRSQRTAEPPLSAWPSASLVHTVGGIGRSVNNKACQARPKKSQGCINCEILVRSFFLFV